MDTNMEAGTAVCAGNRHRRAIIRRYIVSALMCAVAALSNVVEAQSYPDRPVRWIVPWPAGGGADLLARMLHVKVGQILGQPIIIDNRGGAAGNIGASAGAKAAPDGYTITFAYSATHSINPHIYSRMPFSESDFAPVIFLTLVPEVVVVNSSLPVHNVQDLLALAQKRQITYASAGQGSIGHLGGQLLALTTGADMLHVPYRGGGPALVAVLSGDVDVLIGVPVVLAPQIKAGKLRAIGVTTAKRSAVLPDVPTFAESGVPGVDVTSWNGVLVPAGTSPDVIARLNRAFNTAMSDPEVRKQLMDAGYEIVGGEPEKFSAFIAAELAKWAPVVKKAHVQVD